MVDSWFGLAAFLYFFYCVKIRTNFDFKVDGKAVIAGVDNGDPISHDFLKVNYRNAFHGLALAIVQAKEKAGRVGFTATAEGLTPANIPLQLMK